MPYEETAWLSTDQLHCYWDLAGREQVLYAAGIIEDRIVRGRLVNTTTLPPWVPRSLVSVIRKCCALDRESRYASAADLTVRLNNLRGDLPDWRIADHPVLYRGRRRYRIVPSAAGFWIEKSVGGP